MRVTPRTFTGQRKAEPLVRFQNKKNKNEHEQRAAEKLSRLIELNNRVRQLTVPVSHATQDRMFRALARHFGREVPKEIQNKINKFATPDISKPGKQAEVGKALTEINAILHTVSLTPKCVVIVSGQWRLQWLGSGAGNSEASAFFALLDLAASGILHKVGKCSRCEKWFYAITSWSTFCSRRCQLVAYEETETRKTQYKNRKRSTR
jgi:hypothetical protein